MFIFFASLRGNGRRHRTGRSPMRWRACAQRAHVKYDGDGESYEEVLQALQVGDECWCESANPFQPMGASVRAPSVDESLLTIIAAGVAQTRRQRAGRTVNTEALLRIKPTATGAATVLACVGANVPSDKPQLALLADRLLGFSTAC
jgi:hypothetical protein